VWWLVRRELDKGRLIKRDGSFFAALLSEFYFYPKSLLLLIAKAKQSLSRPNTLVHDQKTDISRNPTSCPHHHHQPSPPKPCESVAPHTEIELLSNGGRK
jgi:hypothetical protein